MVPHTFSTEQSTTSFHGRKKLAFTAGGAGSMQVFSDFEHVLTHTRVAGGNFTPCSVPLFISCSLQPPIRTSYILFVVVLYKLFL